MTNLPTVGSVRQIMPAHGHLTITFLDNKERMDLRLVGLAVVVTYVGDDGDGSETEVETSVQPLAIGPDGCPVTLHDLQMDLRGPFTFRVVVVP